MAGAYRAAGSDSLPGISEEVVPVLYVEDAERAVAWYERLGFRKEWEHQFERGFPWFVSVARGAYGSVGEVRPEGCQDKEGMR
jgi:catechol 2,3-dioxygenase-like lactoylglutathione lyase family enzyme